MLWFYTYPDECRYGTGAPVPDGAAGRAGSAALRGRGISYQHRRDLAPTTALRHLQYAADAREGVGKRSRVTFAPEYVASYLRDVLDHVDVSAFARSLPRDSATALLCVERDAPACHRSLIARRLAEELGARVSHLAP